MSKENKNIHTNDIDKPIFDVALCEICDKLTDNFYKDNAKIIWICKKCLKEKCDKNRQNLDHVLEKMCREH
jgi:ribosomal protein L37AE/L43A